MNTETATPATRTGGSGLLPRCGGKGESLCAESVDVGMPAAGSDDTASVTRPAVCDDVWGPAAGRDVERGSWTVVGIMLADGESVGGTTTTV